MSSRILRDSRTYSSPPRLSAKTHRLPEQVEEPRDQLLVFRVLGILLEQVADIALEMLEAILHGAFPRAVVGAAPVHAEDPDVRRLAEHLLRDRRPPRLSESEERRPWREESPCVAIHPVARPRRFASCV